MSGQPKRDKETLGRNVVARAPIASALSAEWIIVVIAVSLYASLPLMDERPALGTGLGALGFAALGWLFVVSFAMPRRARPGSGTGSGEGERPAFGRAGGNPESWKSKNGQPRA